MKPHPLVPTAETSVTEETTLPERNGAEVTPPASAAELAALRARLREVEAALGLPLRPGQATPPDVPDLRQRVAALERRAGVVPGLAPLPGCGDAAAPARATTITSEPDGRGAAWVARGRAALAAAALVAALAWLLHPLPGGPGYFPAAQAPARPAAGATDEAQAPVAVPAGAPATTAAPAEEVPARADYRAQHEGLGPAPQGAPRTPAPAPMQPGLPPCLSMSASGACAPPAPGDDAAGAGAPACHGRGCLTP